MGKSIKFVRFNKTLPQKLFTLHFSLRASVELQPTEKQPVGRLVERTVNIQPPVAVDACRRVSDVNPLGRYRVLCRHRQGCESCYYAYDSF